MFGTLFNQKKSKDESVNQPPLQGQDPAYNNPPQTQPPSQFSQQPEQNAPAPEPPPQTIQSAQPPQQPPATQTQTGFTANPAVRADLSALSHLDPRATQSLTHAQEETRRIRQQHIEADQLLFGLLYDEQIYKLLEESQVDGGALSKEIQAKQKIGVYKGQPTLSKSSQFIFEQAYRDAKMRGSNFVSPEDVFVVLFSPNLSTAAYLQSRGLKKEAVVEKISKNPNSNYTQKTVLEKYGIDLTAEARAGKLDPVAGRDKEVDRIVHILLRRTKNNPIIIGETGVGKTAIVEGLAQKIVAGQVPKELQDKRIFQLDVASLVAGASHRGEFEERMRGVINEVLGSNNKLILFIDEIHALMGTGEGEGMNAANIIKPHLARGHFQLIGATTTIEYRKNFEKDKAFERRFQPVTAEEPSEENAFEMLKVLRPKYEKFHNVTMPDDALKECVKLSKKYIGERYLPDKAVDLLDEAASEVKLQIGAGNRGDNQVKKGDIEKVVSTWTGIPITKLTEDESEKLLKLEDRIHQRLVDQEEAVVAVSEAVRRGRIGLAAANRPIASFVFLGPTGVGKTELAKTLAELLFGRDDAMARLDMSEYMEKHEVAKLIGAPPGYVGYEEGGQLTEAVRKKPYSIVLLDEIEKAHPDVFNILLQLLEDGRLTDNKGNVISFKNTIVICTSNIGSSLIQQQLSQIDPKAKKSTEEHEGTFKELSQKVKEELIKFFRPELLNRFDEVVIFKPLRPEHMAGIARLGIAKTAGLLKEQGYNLQITEKAIAKLAQDGYDPVYGARPLRRLIQTAIENPIALAIISKKFTPGDTIVIDYSDNTNEFVFTKGGQPQSKTPLTDAQFKVILEKIAHPETITNESDKQFFSDLHERAVKASTAGNNTASAILSITSASTNDDVQKIRKELEDAKTKGDEFAKEILAMADTIAQQIEASNNLKKVLLQIVNPATISLPQKKELFTALHEKLVLASQQDNQLAKSILAITDSTSSEELDKIMDELKKAKDREDELAMDIFSAVNTEVIEEAEKVHEAEPMTKFKTALKQVINPLYLATPDNKDKYSHLYDKISQANQQNHPLASSILAITDITSDSDISQLKDQLEAARAQGDPLAAEILDTIEEGIKHDGVSQLKSALLHIINPLSASTPAERTNFTTLHDRITQAGQQGDQLANDALHITEATTDDELTKLQEQLQQAGKQKNEAAILILDAAGLINGATAMGDQTQPAPQQPDPAQPSPAQPVQDPEQNYPFGQGQPDQQLTPLPATNPTMPAQESQMPTPAIPEQSFSAPVDAMQQQTPPAQFTPPPAETAPNLPNGTATNPSAFYSATPPPTPQVPQQPIMPSPNYGTTIQTPVQSPVMPGSEMSVLNAVNEQLQNNVGPISTSVEPEDQSIS